MIHAHNDEAIFEILTKEVQAMCDSHGRLSFVDIYSRASYIIRRPE